MSEDEVYQFPGQHEYDGLNLLPFQSKEMLEYIRDKLKLCEEDVLSVSYMKTGRIGRMDVCVWVDGWMKGLMDGCVCVCCVYVSVCV